MQASRRSGQTAGSEASLRDTLVEAGLDTEIAEALAQMPHRLIQVEPRRPFRESGTPRPEVMFVTSGIVSRFKVDVSGRRQIVALSFPGEGILPDPSHSSCGIQAIVRSEVMVGTAEAFNRVIDAHPELQRFFLRLTQRNEAIGYEWLINCGRRDSTARVAHLLCETAVRSRIHVPDEPLNNPFTQQQIAEITGQTSVNVNRVLADLERQGLIERSGRAITFTDWQEMRRVASFQPAYLD